MDILSVLLKALSPRFLENELIKIILQYNANKFVQHLRLHLEIYINISTCERNDFLFIKDQGCLKKAGETQMTGIFG
jgi:hypothetical protein